MLKRIKVICPAKVSLFLNVLGYDEEKQLHQKKEVNQTINLYDYIDLNEPCHGEEGISITSNVPLSIEEKSFMQQACELFFCYIGMKPSHFSIKVLKNIPSHAGLGSESTDAAGVLLGLNQYYDTNLTKRELIFLGSQISSEVPYFLVGNYAKVTNYGDKIERLSKNPYQTYLIINPMIELNPNEMLKQINSYPFVEQLYNKNQLHNDFTKVIPEEVSRLKRFLIQYPNLCHSLSGIGSSYFIAFQDIGRSSSVEFSLKRNFPNCKLYACENCTGHRFIKICK